MEYLDQSMTPDEKRYFTVHANPNAFTATYNDDVGQCFDERADVLVAHSALIFIKSSSITPKHKSLVKN